MFLIFCKLHLFMIIQLFWTNILIDNRLKYRPVDQRHYTLAERHDISIKTQYLKFVYFLRLMVQSNTTNLSIDVSE